MILDRNVQSVFRKISLRQGSQSTVQCTMEVVHEKIRRSLNIEKALNNFSLFLSKCKTYCCYKVFDFFGWKYTCIFNSVLGTHHIFVYASLCYVVLSTHHRGVFSTFPSQQGHFKSRITLLKDTSNQGFLF